MPPTRSDHHPDIDVRYPDLVRVLLYTHAVGALTTTDVDLARTISAIAADAGATAEPTTPQAVEIAIDTMDADRIRPFWAAVLGYRRRRQLPRRPAAHRPTRLVPADGLAAH